MFLTKCDLFVDLFITRLLYEFQKNNQQCYFRLMKFSVKHTLSQTLKPSDRRHKRWASIHFVHADSPCSTMHSSLNFLVSGQAQHILFFGFVSVTTTSLLCWTKEHALSCACKPLILSSYSQNITPRKLETTFNNNQRVMEYKNTVTSVNIWCLTRI